MTNLLDNAKKIKAAIARAEHTVPKRVELVQGDNIGLPKGEMNVLAKVMKGKADKGYRIETGYRVFPLNDNKLGAVRN